MAASISRVLSCCGQVLKNRTPKAGVERPAARRVRNEEAGDELPPLLVRELERAVEQRRELPPESLVDERHPENRS